MRILNFLKISQGIKDIAKQMIDNPHDWEQTDYHYRNKTHRDIAIWTSNGHFALKIEGFDGLSWAEKHYLADAIKQSIANKLTPKN